jgi:hypothetical protein
MSGKISFPNCLVLILAFFFLDPAYSFGGTFCVNNSTELQTALTTAAGNGEDDLIQIVQGTYNGNFTYDSYDANSLTIEGGYTSDWASRTIDPKNTILDGGGVDNVMIFYDRPCGGEFFRGRFDNSKWVCIDGDKLRWGTLCHNHWRNRSYQQHLYREYRWNRWRNQR